MNLFKVFILVTLLTSCGKGGSDENFNDYLKEEPTSQSPEQENTGISHESTSNETFEEGVYLAELRVLNSHLVGDFKGAATISIHENEIIGDVRVFNGSLSTVHSQKVYFNSICPDKFHDKNADGLIDSVEALESLGKIFIPLDGDLHSQESEADIYPLSDAYGNYIYTEKASFIKFLGDLRNQDHVSGYKKLLPHEKFSIEGKAVLIQGKDGLPMACGRFKKINSIPGRDYDDQVGYAPSSDMGETVGGSDGGGTPTPSTSEDSSRRPWWRWWD